jgi:hypothetical protein
MSIPYSRGAAVLCCAVVAVVVSSLALFPARGSAPRPAAAPIQSVAAAGTVCEVSPPACVPVIAPGYGMAVPLLTPWLRGTDVAWKRFTTCCADSNEGHAASVSGLLGSRTARVVPTGSTSIEEAAGRATSSIVYDVSGRNYRYVRYDALVSRQDETGDPAMTDWTVQSDVFTHTCHQHGATRNHVVDCSNGTQRYTRGSLQIPTTPITNTIAVTVPITYASRPVDSRGRPLSTPTKTATGHWKLDAQTRYNGWLWSVDWSVSGVAAGRVAGSAYSSGSHIVMTDGPFN